MKQVSQVQHFRAHQLLSDGISVLAGGTLHLRVPVLLAKQAVVGLAVDVPTQRVEFSSSEELANLSDAALSERLLNAMNRDKARRTGKCGGRPACACPTSVQR
jgi:hypothetical protein